MNETERQRHRKLLEETRDQILGEGDVPIEPNRRDATSVGMDEDEQPLNEMAQAIASSRNRARRGSLAQIQAALVRLGERPDEFGLCLSCEEPIPERRLSLMPYVELCVECQRKEDGPRQPSSRKSLTDYK